MLVPNFLHLSLEKKPVYDHIEKYDPAMQFINSVDVLIRVADSIAEINQVKNGSLQYAIIVSTIIRSRFYHGFSIYPLNENWIAAIGEKIFGLGLASLVKPDDILKYRYGGCSQQTIILMEVMRRKGISYRSVGFPHHYASELAFQNNWYFFDPNMEPKLSDSDRCEQRWKGSADSLKKFYDRNHFKDLDWKFGNNLPVTLGLVNATPAPHAVIFQTVTYYLSRTLWLIPLILAFRRRTVIK